MGKVTRALYIIWILASHLVFHEFNRHRGKTLGLRMREAAEALGTTFIKIGQVLSTRYELLDERTCEELRALLDNVPPIPYDLVEELFIHEFSKPPQEIFKSFNKIPIACASIAQVHKATLDNGEEVAVKVRRPFIGTTIEYDIKILRMAVGLAQLYSSDLRHFRAKRIVDEAGSWLLKEIDFENEKKNILRFGAEYGSEKIVRKDLGRLIIPKVYDELCSYSIITMEFIEGIPVTRYKEVIDHPEYDVIKSTSTYGIAPLRRWLRKKHLLIHGDPHPSNLLILKHGNMALVDFGLIGEIGRRESELMSDLFYAVYTQDLEKTILIITKLSGCSYEKYADKIRPDLKRYLQDAPSEGIGYWFAQAARIMIRHRVPVPLYMAIFGRSNLIADGMIHMISPGETTLDLLEDELKEGIKRKMIDNVLGADYFRVLYKLSEKMKDNPQTLMKIIDRYYDDPLKIVRDVRRNLKAEGI